ncbi:MAG: hypothetical protein Q4P15_02330 [Propionibacteriaceae bacterium]|nr:hypothetical protein [Propionibacteriaceae bacterium]
MKILRKFLAISAAVVVALASGVTVAHAASPPTVYDTPGGHISGDRLWNTECEKYSSNVVRCSTKIWATQVHLQGGRYVWKTGWTFNNLSYLSSPRASWAGNNLGRTNNRWVSGGKTWRTECDTATTGQGGCRSYVWTKQVQAKKSGSRWVYSNAEGWVFNNLVLFSSAKLPAVNKVPAWIIDTPGQWLEPQGLRWGPIRLTHRGEDLARLGYLREVGPSTCRFLDSSPSLENRGVRAEFSQYGTWFVALDTGFIPTKAGARVGMTVGQVKALHGAAFKVVPKDHYEETHYFGSVREGAYELQFRVEGEFVDEYEGEKYYEYAPRRPLVDSDVIVEISAQEYTDDVSWDVC